MLWQNLNTGLALWFSFLGEALASCGACREMQAFSGAEPRQGVYGGTRDSFLGTGGGSDRKDE